MSIRRQGRLWGSNQKSNVFVFNIINKCSRNPKIQPESRDFATFWLNFAEREIARFWRPPTAARCPSGSPVDPSDRLRWFVTSVGGSGLEASPRIKNSTRNSLWDSNFWLNFDFLVEFSISGWISGFRRAEVYFNDTIVPETTYWLTLSSRNKLNNNQLHHLINSISNSTRN